MGSPLGVGVRAVPPAVGQLTLSATQMRGHTGQWFISRSGDEHPKRLPHYDPSSSLATAGAGAVRPHVLGDHDRIPPYSRPLLNQWQQDTPPRNDPGPNYGGTVRAPGPGLVARARLMGEMGLRLHMRR